MSSQSLRGSETRIWWNDPHPFSLLSFFLRVYPAIKTAPPTLTSTLPILFNRLVSRRNSIIRECIPQLQILKSSLMRGSREVQKWWNIVVFSYLQFSLGSSHGQQRRTIIWEWNRKYSTLKRIQMKHKSHINQNNILSLFLLLLVTFWRIPSISFFFLLIMFQASHFPQFTLLTAPPFKNSS